MNKFLLALFCLISTALSASPKYYLSVCAIFRNEDRFLKEWIEYHRMIGVEHFYLFNHLSDDDYLDVLSPYIKEGIVDLVNWPFHPTSEDDWIENIQCGAYRKVLKESGDQNFWIAFIDTDEFIVLTEEDSLPNYLSQFEGFGGLVINWLIFGTSNVKRIPENRTLIETLTLRAPLEINWNVYVKSIVQPKAVASIQRIHQPIYKKSFYSVNERKERCEPAEENYNIGIAAIRINHYTQRDEDFFYNVKMILRRGNNRTCPPIQPNPEYNKVEDLTISRFVPELEKRLFSKAGILKP
ncbi:MAG: hypothetical protein KR126chlam1_01117 [Chlamydiae bacterium]|nr:hypothetical protein [Chlamydiota bacterium]